LRIQGAKILFHSPYCRNYAVADNSENSLKKEASDVQVAAVVNSGREVRIEFLEGVKNE
jgi:hypothetical protein